MKDKSNKDKSGKKDKDDDGFLGRVGDAVGGIFGGDDKPEKPDKPKDHKPVMGQIVRFVLAPGVIRPAIVTNVMSGSDGMTVDVEVFLNGPAEVGYSRWVGVVNYDATKLVKTWHWAKD